MSHLTYVRVSDLTPGEHIPLDLGYGGYPPPRDFYQASTWDVYGTNLPPYPSGSNGNIYVPRQGQGGPYGTMGSIRSRYGDADNFGVTGPGLGYGPSRSSGPQNPQGPYPGFPNEAPPLLTKKGRPGVEGFSPNPDFSSVGETPLDDPVFSSPPPPLTETSKGFKIKNPLLVLAFLLAIYGAFQFFWLGIDQFLATRSGGKMSWKGYIGWSVALFGLTMLASILLNFSFLRLEELNG